MISAPLALVVALSASDLGEPPDTTAPPIAGPESPDTAEPEGPKPEPEPEPPDATEPEDPLELAAQAEQAFADGRFEQVVELAARAYALTGDPRHLYAQALAERRLERCREALILYARVLARVKDDPVYAALVEGTRQGITLCEQSLDTDPAPKEPTPLEPKPEPEPAEAQPTEPKDMPGIEPPAHPWYRDPAGGAMLAMGVAVGAGAGGALWALSRRELEAADRASDETVYADALTGARAQRLGAIVSFSIGGALVAGAVIRYVLVDRKYRRQTAWVAPLPGGLGLGWRATF